MKFIALASAFSRAPTPPRARSSHRSAGSRVAFASLYAATSILALAAVGGARSDDAASRHEAGRKIYNFHCYFCHGYSGNAQTVASRYLEPPPRDFTSLAPDALARERMLESVRTGRPGTAMMSFGDRLGPGEIAAVVDFIRVEFMSARRPNTHYHTIANGWPGFERHRAAFPWAMGEASLDTPVEELSSSERAGRRIFLTTCTTCHDARADSRGDPVWEKEAISYPRFGFRPSDIAKPPDAWSGASSFAVHDVRPVIAGLDPRQRLGERLYQDNCAFCHAADGTGRNWIGQFMQPHPRDLTDATFMSGMTRARLEAVIRNGLPGTSMPAWGAVLDAEQIGAIADYVDEAFHRLARER